MGEPILERRLSSVWTKGKTLLVCDEAAVLLRYHALYHTGMSRMSGLCEVPKRCSVKSKYKHILSIVMFLSLSYSATAQHYKIFPILQNADARAGVTDDGLVVGNVTNE